MGFVLGNIFSVKSNQYDIIPSKICIHNYKIKTSSGSGTWLTQPVEHATYDFRVVSMSLTLGIEIT